MTFLLSNVRSFRHKYYTVYRQGIATCQKGNTGITTKWRARLLAPSTGDGKGLRLSDIGRTACALTLAGRLTLS
jgi:hypothetical protein